LKEGADDYILKPVRQPVMKNLWSNVWKKRKEHQIVFQLENERNKCSTLDKELSDLKNKVEDLNSKIHQAVDTPISVITRTILQLQRQANLTTEVKTALSNILQSLSTSNLYKPALFKIIDNNTLDSDTKKWLLAELGSSLPDLLRNQNEVRWSNSNEYDNQMIISELQSYSFNVWQQKEENLVDYVIKMFNDFHLLEVFPIGEDKLRSFLNTIQSKYHKSNPYHNFIHAFDVTQSVYSFLTTGKGALYLTHIEILSLLVAALCHDVDHPGLTNLFLIATSHPFSIRFNDTSVLENHHASTTFELLSNPEINIFSNFSNADYRTIRKLIISCILATDLSKHMEIINKVEAIRPNFTKDEADHRLLFMQLLIKFADISNPSRPFSIARYWADLVQQEYFIQGDKERDAGIEVSVFNDRENKQLAKMQTGFADFFVIPLCTLVTKVLPDTKPILETLHENRRAWELIKD